ncbi:tRNA-specific adenosine deaminase subunit TAD2 [Paragonimus kellicotti]|nr:tRNA-specific adenosine deaminase subunit TAD2 [Paragonimus kellicotti]
MYFRKLHFMSLWNPALCVLLLYGFVYQPPLKALNERFGGCGSVFDIHSLTSDKPILPCVSGLQKERAVLLLKQFYTQENSNAPEQIRKSKQSRATSFLKDIC